MLAYPKKINYETYKELNILIINVMIIKAKGKHFSR